jgi:hypothetical protein
VPKHVNIGLIVLNSFALNGLPFQCSLRFALPKSAEELFRMQEADGVLFFTSPILARVSVGFR